METNTTSNNSQPLTSTESFSYSWLSKQPPSNSSPQKTNISNTPTFNFDLSMSNSNPSSSLVHADKLFSNGLILPRRLEFEPSRQEGTCSSSSPSLLSPLQLVSSKINHPSSSSSSSSPLRRLFIGKWSKFIPGKVISKYIKCLVPMKESIAMSGTRVDDVNRLTWKAKSWSTNNTPQIASPMRESGAYCNAWSDIDESSIREAILYCKRSSSGLC